MQTLTSRSTSRRRWARFLVTGATALVAATTIGSVAGAATTTTSASGVANGSVAALQASSMEVQNPSTGQTTVNWTTSTQFSKTVSESVSVLTAGDCVTVTGTPSKSSKTTIAARSITVRSPSSTGSCTSRTTSGGTSNGGAFAGPGGFNFRRSGTGGTRPSFPAGSARRFAGGLSSLAIASGKVTGVSGSTVSVSGVDISPGSFSRNKASSSKSSKTAKPVAPKTENLKITTSGSTTLSSTQSAAATDLAVGDCVTAFGPAATNGAVTATTVRITSTGGASCTGGFGGGGFFRGGVGGGAPGGGSA